MSGRPHCLPEVLPSKQHLTSPSLKTVSSPLFFFYSVLLPITEFKSLIFSKISLYAHLASRFWQFRPYIADHMWPLSCISLVSTHLPPLHVHNAPSCLPDFTCPLSNSASTLSSHIFQVCHFDRAVLLFPVLHLLLPACRLQFRVLSMKLQELCACPPSAP